MCLAKLHERLQANLRIRRFMSSPSVSVVLSNAVNTDSLEVTNWICSKGYSAFPKLSVNPVHCPRQQCRQWTMLASNKHRNDYITVTCATLRSFYCESSSHEPQKNGHQYKCFWTQYFACTLPYIVVQLYHRNINIIYIIVYNISVTWSFTSDTKLK